jgi:hypothetical protein
MSDNPRYSVFITRGPGPPVRAPIDFSDDPPVAVACGSPNPVDDYFVIRRLSGRTSVYFCASGISPPLSIPEDIRASSIGCSGPSLFVSSARSVFLFSIGTYQSGLIAKGEVRLASPVRTVFADSGGCYGMTDNYRLYRISIKCFAEGSDPLCFHEPVLLADCLNDCLAVFTKRGNLYCILTESDWEKPTPKTPLPDVVKNGHLPAAIHRVSRASVAWEMEPGVLWVDNKGVDTISISLCCKRTSLKFARADRRSIATKKGRHGWEELLMDTTGQIVDFDELVRSPELVVIERDPPSRFGNTDPGSFAGVLRELPIPSHPLDCQLILAGISALLGDDVEDELLDTILLALTKIATVVDPLQYARVVDRRFVARALRITTPLAQTYLAEVVAHAIKASPYINMLDLCAPRIPPPTEQQLCKVYSSGLNALNSVNDDRFASTAMALVQYLWLMQVRVADIAARFVGRPEAVPLQAAEAVIDVMLLRPSDYGPDQIAVLAGLTLQVFGRQDLTMRIRRGIEDLWGAENREVLQRALARFCETKQFVETVRRGIDAAAITSAVDIEENLLSVMAQMLPFLNSPEAGNQLAERLRPFINRVVAAGKRVVVLRQRLTCLQEMDNGILAKALSDFE